MARVRLNWEGETVADRYRITNRLGEGGMGTVYRATDLQSGKTVALKTPRIALLEDPAFFKRFQREMQALLQLRHPHIVPVLDVGEHKRIPFFVMPYLSGGNLRQRLKEKLARGPDDLFPWLAQIAAALDYLHAQNVVHRDVKPDNVLFDEQGVAYLTDLGAVKVQEGSSVDARTKLTATGTALGTPPYMAPELILGRPYDGRADQYALAVIVYEAFTGQHPYDASSLGALIQSLQGPEAERLDSRCGAPTGVAEAVARGLARDPNQRFPSCTEFAKAVRVGFVRSPATLKSPARPSGAGAGAGDRPAPRVMPTVAAGTPPPVIAPGKARAASGDTPAPVGPGLAPTIAASPGAGVPPPVPPTVAASPLPAEPGGVSRAEGFDSPAQVILLPSPTRRRSRREASLFQELKRTVSDPVIFTCVIAGVFMVGMLLLAVLFALLRSNPDSARQLPGSGPSPNRGGSEAATLLQLPDGIWRVGQNNLTFEQAVARALPGDTIQVPAGPFNLTQPIVVSKSLTIRGAGPDKTILASSAPDFAIRFTGECQWTLEGLSIEHLGGEPANVVVVDSGVITIRNCRFSGAVWDETSRRGGSGIWLTGSARGVVSNCVCRNNGLHGIALSGQAQPILEGNTCEGNKYSGIAYFETASGTARNNTCRNNGLHGIGVNGQAQPHLEGNTCEGNKDSGIAYFQSAGGTARNNTCCNNGEYGIYTRPGTRPILEGNREEGNKRGIWRVGQNNLIFEQAVAGAQPGDTIEVPAGRFTLTQSVLVNKSLTIRGAGPDKTTLLSWEPDFAIKFTGNCQWTLENLSLEHVGNKPADVVIVDSGVITIRNCRFSGAVWDETNRRGGDGIWLTGTARGVVINCVCRNNGLHGIELSGQAQATLEGNTCESNKECGIAYFGSAGGTARNNTCRKNQADGIGLGGEAKPVLEGNSCIENKLHGVWYLGKASGRAVNNTCSQNEASGIAVWGQAQPTLEGNTCEGNKYSGIVYFGSAGGIARNNTCRNNGLHGIALSGQAQPTLEGNTCEGNTQSGIAYFETASGTARNNTCRNNGLNGIGLRGQAQPTVEGNTCRNNEGHGIQVSGQAQPTLEGNSCESNKECGIAYFDSAGGIARNNICRNNGDNGIYVRKGARPLLGPNILEGNRGGNLNVE